MTREEIRDIDELYNEIEESEEIEEPELEAAPSEYPTGDALGAYLREIGRKRLLTAEEEVQMAQAIERGRDARERIAKGDISGPELAQAQAEVESGERAKRDLIEHNLRLVVSVARRYVGHGLPLSDLIEEGNLGLMRAAEKFDWRRGFRFSTYATWWIRQAVARGLAEGGRTIRLPVHVGEALTKIGRESQRLSLELGREPTPEELSEAVGIPAERIGEYMDAARLPFSLEAPLTSGEEASLGEVIEDTEAASPEVSAGEAMLREDINRALSPLTERQRAVITMRYGLEDDEPMTLEAIGKRLGITRERVRQIEQEAMQRLRRPESVRVLEAHAA